MGKESQVIKMWADFINNFNLSITKEDIEKYEKMKKEKKARNR